MVDTLESAGIPLMIRTEYMDTKFLSSPEYLELLAEEYSLKYAAHPPAVILVSDDKGLQFLLTQRDEVFPGIPIVFCGINQEQGSDALPEELIAENTTGVVEQIEIEANIRLVLDLHPDVSRILMFTDDSASGKSNFAIAQQALADVKPGIETVLRNDLSLEDVLADAPTWQPGDVFIDICTLTNRDGIVVDHALSCREICAAASVPAYGCWTYMVGLGVVGGRMTDGVTQGSTAARMVLEILQGTAVDDIPVQYTCPDTYIFDYQQIKQFHIPMHALPPGSVIYNQPATIFEQYPEVSYAAIGVTVLLLAIIVFMCIISRIRQQADRQLVLSEERLRLAVQNVPVMLWAYDHDGVTLVWNRECERVTGFSAQEIVGNRHAFDLTYPDPMVREALLEKRRSSQGDVENWECPIACKDGAWRTISMTNISARYPVPGWASWGIGIDVTARKQAEHQLKESRSHYYRLVTLAQEGIVSVDEDEVITFANPAFCQVLGYEPHEIIGRPLPQFGDIQNFERIRQETAHRRRHSISVYELCLRTRTGELRDFLVSASPLLSEAGDYEGSLGVFTDITQLKLIEDALRRSEESYRQLVESLPVGVVVVHQTGDLGFVNTAAASLFGAQPAQLLGCQFTGLLTAPSREHWRRWGAPSNFVGLMHQPIEVQLEQPDGTVLDVELRATPTMMGGAPGTQLLMTDIRERKQLLSQQIQQHKEESITTLAGGLAHDFNNILLGIIGAVNLLSQSRTMPPEDLELCNVISISAERMAELTKKLLAFARGGKVDPRVIDVRQVINNAFLISHGTLPATITTEIDLAPGLWPVLGDAAQLEQVFLNLIVNAVEAVTDGKGLIHVTAENQLVEHAWQCSQHNQHPAGQYIVIKVQDSGAGMDLETQRRIFDPFFSTKFQGRGLGLAVAASIVRAHQGCLTVASHAGQGSTFTLMLPKADQVVGRPIIGLS